jgi:hypothetical protein
MATTQATAAAAPQAQAPQTAQGGDAYPLVRRLGLKQILERDAPKPPDAPQEIEDEEVLSGLAGHVRLAWQRNKLYKERIDQKLLRCLRARRGVYSSQEIADLQQAQGGINIVWAPLTEVKSRAGSAWVRDIVTPVGEQPWGLESSPLPDLPMDMKKAIVRKAITQAQAVMQQAAQAGGGVMDPDEFRDLAIGLGEKLRRDAETTYKKLADKRAGRMESTIADRMAEGNFHGAMDAFIEDFTTFPAAILKGPIYKREKKLSWGPGWTPKVTNEPKPWFDRVSPFDIYPAPGSKTPQKGDLIERLRFQREELWDLKGVEGYRDEDIDGALRDYSNGHLEGWLWTEAERQRLEQETMYMWLSPPGVIDALCYWGRIPGWKLMSFGMTGLEETKEYEANVIVCGRYVLYASLNPDPLGHRPYHKACYDEIPGAFWGRSVPDLAETPQKMCNGIACAFADNMGQASGPQLWVHVDRLADGEQSMESFPWKVWQLKSDPSQGVNPGIGAFDIPNHANELMMAYEKWEIRADDSTGIPRYTYGNERAGGSADTATGLSMLMNNAAKGLRRGISNIDSNVIEPVVYLCFVNEMLYNPDETIKGDCRAIPRGAAMILIRESAQQRRIQFLEMTANPIDAGIITPKYRVALLRETAAAMELPVDECVPTDEALAEEQAKMQEANAQAAQQAQQQMLLLEQAKTQGGIQIEAVKQKGQLEQAQLKLQGESVMHRDEMLNKIIEQAVASAFAQQAAATKAEGSGEGKAKRKVKHNYDDSGALVSSELE